MVKTRTWKAAGGERAELLALGVSALDKFDIGGRLERKLGKE
jgi:hypothetical protein